MPRHPDPLRKPQLLAEILDYLLDKSLASVSFRTIAQALGFSTYTLVYHFGSRAQLMREIMEAVTERQDAVVTRDKLAHHFSFAAGPKSTPGAGLDGDQPINDLTTLHQKRVEARIEAVDLGTQVGQGFAGGSVEHKWPN